MITFFGLSVSPVYAATKTWDGGGGDESCSTAGNWNGDTIPTSSDDIVFDATSAKDYTWDTGCPLTVASLTQDMGYTGTGTIATTYDSTFPIFTISGNLTLTNGGLTHTDNSTAETYRLRVNVGGNLIIGTGSVIDADAIGYDGGKGPGAPSGGSRPAGSHGGLGAPSTSILPPSTTYGSITEPENLGSGGKAHSGGGAVMFTVTGSTVVYGTVRADAVAPGGDWGGAAGGSVFLTTGTIDGPGIITANGKPGSNNKPGGGGGRVAVILLDGGADFTAFEGSINAYGGDSGSSYKDGAAGTVYQETAAQSSGGGTLIIDNNNLQTKVGVQTLMPSSVDLSTFGNIIIQNDANLSVDSDDTLAFGSVTLSPEGRDEAEITITDTTGVTFPSAYTLSGYTLNIDSEVTTTSNWTIESTGRLSHTGNFSSEVFKLFLNLTGNLTVDSGGEINTNADGYTSGGPGAPYGSARQGGGHGGLGGSSTSVLSTSRTYGSMVAPINLGSNGSGHVGGGAIIVTVSGVLTNNGAISANAADPAIDQGGGAGGSIFLTVGSIAGTGSITADGMQGSNAKPGGGGGRVAIILESTDEDFSGYSGSITAYGGDSTSSERDGAAGTVYKQAYAQQPSSGSVIVSNFATATIKPDVITIMHLVTGTSATIGSVLLDSNGIFRVGSGDILTLSDAGTTLDVRSGTTLLNSGSLALSGTGFTISGTYTNDEASSVFYTGQSDDQEVTMLNASYGNLAVNNPSTTFNTAANISATTLTISGGILNANGSNVTVSSTFRILSGGTLALNGDETISTPTFETGGTIMYNGTGTYSELIVGDTYQNLSLSGSGIWSLDATLDVNEKLTLSGGTLRQESQNITIAGDFTLNDGSTLVANAAQTITLDGNLTLTDNSTTKQNLGHLIIGSSPDTIELGSDITVTTLEIGTGDTLNTHGYDITVGTGGILIYGTLDATDDIEGDKTIITNAGNWERKSIATFTHGTGSVVMNGLNQSMSGSNVFYHFTKTASAEDTFTIGEGTQQNFSGSLTLQGNPGQDVSIRSSTSGVEMTFLVGTSASYSFANIDVKDNNAAEGQTLSCHIDNDGCTDSGNNTSWLFPQTSGGAAARQRRNQRQPATSGGGSEGSSGGGSPSLSEVGIYNDVEVANTWESEVGSGQVEEVYSAALEPETFKDNTLIKERREIFIERVCQRVENWFRGKPDWVNESVMPRLNRRLNERWEFTCIMY